MDLSKYRAKLIGNEEERAVSPVIGVILMVAITVILAAVIAAFVLDMGDDMGEGNVNAAVSVDVSNSDQEVEITVDDMGNAEKFVLRGEGVDSEEELSLDETGDSTTVTEGSPLNDDSGSVNIVAINGDAESRISSFEWDWTDIAGEPDSISAVSGESANADGEDEVTFTVTVEDADGTTVPNAEVVVDEAEDVSDLGGISAGDTATTNSNGEAEFTATSDTAGTFTVQFSESDAGSDTADATFE